MLTKVVLDGPMGDKFGREWELEVSSPAAALRLIDANVGGLKGWIRDNVPLYSHYRVVCEYEDGRIEQLNDDTFPLERKLKSITFAPQIQGSGGVVKFVVGALLIIASFYIPGSQAFLLKMGASLMLSGVIEMLTTPPKVGGATKQEDVENGTSYYFNGPVNTVSQGVPVQLIYGRVLVGSHPISAFVNIDQIT